MCAPPLARRLARHACTWHGPLQQGAMSTQSSQTRFKNHEEKCPATQSTSRLFGTEKLLQYGMEKYAVPMVILSFLVPTPPT